MHLRTLLRNGAPLSPLLPIACALFPSPHSFHSLAASLPSLSTLFCIRSLCFQSFAASFPKAPGVRRALHRQPRRTRNGNGKSYLLRLGALASYQERGVPCLSGCAPTFMRLAQTTFFCEWLAGLLLCARERSLLQLTQLQSRRKLRPRGSLALGKDGRLPPLPWDRTGRCALPKTAPTWFIKFIPTLGTNTLTRVPSTCTLGTAIFAASGKRRRET
jgi:hypothetical protein